MKFLALQRFEIKVFLCRSVLLFKEAHPASPTRVALNEVICPVSSHFNFIYESNQFYTKVK